MPPNALRQPSALALPPATPPNVPDTGLRRPTSFAGSSPKSMPVFTTQDISTPSRFFQAQVRHGANLARKRADVNPQAASEIQPAFPGTIIRRACFPLQISIRQFFLRTCDEMQECAGIENGRDAVVRSPPSLHSSDSLSLLLPSSQ